MTGDIGEDRFHVGQRVRDTGAYRARISFPLRIQSIYVIERDVSHTSIRAGMLIADCIPDGRPDESQRGFPLRDLTPWPADGEADNEAER